MMCFIYYLLCVLLPICIPVPEAAVVLWETNHIGSLQSFLPGITGSMPVLTVMYTCLH